MEYLCHKYDKIWGHILEIYAILTYTPVHGQMETGSSGKFWVWWMALDGSGSLEVSINASIIVANYKVLLRWYMVPDRLATYTPVASPVCFRGCGQVGMAYHIWWQCSKVRQFSIIGYNFYLYPHPSQSKSSKHTLLESMVEEAS